MITKAEFKKFIGIDVTSYDDAIDQIIKGIQSYVEAYCKNVLTEQEVEEFFDSNEILENKQNIFLANRVNLSNFKLYYNTGNQAEPVWVEENAKNYGLYLKQGLVGLTFVRRVASINSGLSDYKATYKAGFKAEEMPDDIKLACLKLASAFFNKRKAEGLKSESLEGASVNFGEALTDEVKGLLLKYKSY